MTTGRDRVTAIAGAGDLAAGGSADSAVRHPSFFRLRLFGLRFLDGRGRRALRLGRCGRRQGAEREDARDHGDDKMTCRHWPIPFRYRGLLITATVVALFRLAAKL